MLTAENSLAAVRPASNLQLGKLKHNQTPSRKGGPRTTAPFCRPEGKGVQKWEQPMAEAVVRPCSCARSPRASQPGSLRLQDPCAGARGCSSTSLCTVWEGLQEITLPQVSSRVTHKGKEVIEMNGRRVRPSSSPHSLSPSRHSVGRARLCAALGCAGAQ